MEINLWVFLSVTIIFGTTFLTILAVVINKRKLKELEVEALKVKHIHLKQEVEEEVSRQLKQQNDRIEVLEAIVTEKNYGLNEKITNLK